MKILTVAVIVTSSLSLQNAIAQRGGHGGAGMARPGRPIFAGGRASNPFRFNRSRFGFGAGGFGWGLPGFGWGFPDYFGDYAPPANGWGADDGPGNIVLMPVPVAVEPPPPPPPPARPVMHEYHWPQSANMPFQPFSIVTKDGKVYAATMVWTQGDTIHFNVWNGGVDVMPLASISRELTEAANDKKNLHLPLP